MPSRLAEIKSKNYKRSQRRQLAIERQEISKRWAQKHFYRVLDFFVIITFLIAWFNQDQTDLQSRILVFILTLKKEHFCSFCVYVRVPRYSSRHKVSLIRHRQVS